MFTSVDADVLYALYEEIREQQRKVGDYFAPFAGKLVTLRMRQFDRQHEHGVTPYDLFMSVEYELFSLFQKDGLGSLERESQPLTEDDELFLSSIEKEYDPLVKRYVELNNNMYAFLNGVLDQGDKTLVKEIYDSLPTTFDKYDLFKRLGGKLPNNQPKKRKKRQFKNPK
jgi:hypothetical protein